MGTAQLGEIQEMSKLYQIYDCDLSELESILPTLSDSLAIHMNNVQRKQFRRVQFILNNVRWNYGPHTDVEVVD